MRFRWGQALLVFLIVWLLVLLYLVFPLWKSSENEEKLAQAQNEVSRLNSENEKLRDLLKGVQEQLETLKLANHRSDAAADHQKQENVDKVEKLRQEVSNIVDGPSKIYELSRRKIQRDVNEFWFFVRSKLEQAAKHASDKMNQVLIQ
jgi:hypothetical protein